MRITPGVVAFLCLAASASADDSLDESRAQTVVPSRPIEGTHNCENYYPKLSMLMNESGDVRVAYDVDSEGNIVHVHVVRTSGNDRLDNAAVACVASHWRNTAALRGGKPVASPGHQAIIQFRMRGHAGGTVAPGAPGSPKPPIFDLKAVPWDKFDAGLLSTILWTAGFLGACGFAAFINWLIYRRRD